MMINNVLRNMLTVAAPIALVTALGFSQVTFAGDDFEASFEDSLNAASDGLDRFQYGLLLNFGLQGSSKVDIPNTTENFELGGYGFELGGYTMISVIQDSLDIEVGAVYNVLTSSDGSTNSNAEYLSFYAALVALPAEDYGISLGYIHVPSISFSQMTTSSFIGVDPLYADIIGGKGLFIEYQGIDHQNMTMSVKLQHTNLNVGRSNNSLDVGVTSLNMGFKR